MAMHEHTRGRLLLVVRTSVMTCAVHWTKVITLVSVVSEGVSHSVMHVVHVFGTIVTGLSALCSVHL